MYGHDRRALDTVLAAVEGEDATAATSFEEARWLVARLVPEDPSSQ
jgi:hypothetical protein